MHLDMHSYFIEIVCWKHKAQVPALLCVLFISWNVPPRGINIADQTHISPHDIAKNIDPRRSSRQTVTNDMTGIWHENQWPVGCRWLPLVADQRQTQYHFGYRERGRQHVKPFPGKVLRPWQRLNGCCLNNSKTWLCLHASRPPNCFDLYGHPDGMQCIKCAYTAAAVAFCTWHWLSLFALFITFLKAETIGKSFSRTFVRAGEWQSCYVD